MNSPKPLKLSKTHVDRDLCIGAATCATISPTVYQMDEENKAIVLDVHSDMAENVLTAAESCPTKAVFLYDEDGNQIYPYT